MTVEPYIIFNMYNIYTNIHIKTKKDSRSTLIPLKFPFLEQNILFIHVINYIFTFFWLEIEMLNYKSIKLILFQNNELEMSRNPI